jgi:acylphosphatase
MHWHGETWHNVTIAESATFNHFHIFGGSERKGTMTQRKQLRINGRVQGVGFRLACADLARSLELTGFVCNEPDGSVLIEVEGEPRALEPFLSWCHTGPPGAKVTDVDETDLPLQRDRSFEITRAQYQAEVI